MTSWCTFSYILVQYTPRTTTLKPSTGDETNIDHLISMQCSAWKPWLLAFMWMPLDMNHPSKHCCGPRTPPSSQQHYPMAVAPQQGNVPWHTTLTAQGQLEEHNKGPKLLLASKFSRSQSDRTSVRCAGGAGLEATTPNIQDPEDPL